jgi:hypothetical protein
VLTKLSPTRSRGVVHEARTLEQSSTHLTLTVTVVRWITVLQQLVAESANRERQLRRALPPSVFLGLDRSCPPLLAELVNILPTNPRCQRRCRIYADAAEFENSSSSGYCPTIQLDDSTLIEADT